MIYGCAIDIYNKGHPKFKLKIKPEVQEEYASLFKYDKPLSVSNYRLSVIQNCRHRWHVDNPLMTEEDDPFDVDISVCPKDESSGWTEIELEHLEDHRAELELPTVTDGNIQAFDDMCLGTFGRTRGSHYVAGLR